MNIQLKDITNDNWLECIYLTTNKKGKHFVCEEFVASNALSIAQAKIQKGWITKAIYNGETMVGFIMYGFCYENNFYEICRLMIHHEYQGKGYGRAALGKAIDEFKKISDCDEIFVSFYLKNQVGQKIYESFGFRHTGKILDGEALYHLKLK